MNLTYTEEQILARSYDTSLTKRRQVMVVVVGALALAGVVAVPNVIEDRSMISWIMGLYVVVTVAEKWAYGNGVLLYKSVIRKLDTRVKKLEQSASMESINRKLPDPWPFDQPSSCAVLTTRHVLRDGQPVTHVFHDADDHGWQFHYSGDKADGDAMIVALAEICEHDPSVMELADLPPGWMATRSSAGAPWERAPCV